MQESDQRSPLLAAWAMTNILEVVAVMRGTKRWFVCGFDLLIWTSEEIEVGFQWARSPPDLFPTLSGERDVLLLASVPTHFAPIVWTLLALAGACGIVALSSPRLFSKLAAVGSRWVDTSNALAKLDRRIEVDSRILPYSRWLGLAVVVSVALLAGVLSGR